MDQCTVQACKVMTDHHGDPEEYPCWSTCLTLSEGDPALPTLREMIEHLSGESLDGAK